MSPLVDERARPPLRDRIGRLLAAADDAVLALDRIRLAALDLSPEELRGVGHCRVLLGRLDASTLLDAAETRQDPTRGAHLGALLVFADSGRLEVRSAGVGGWAPDFSVFRGPAGATALLGAHYFGTPYPTIGPSFTHLTTDAAAVRLLAERFDGLWDVAHDVLPAVRDVLARAGASANG